LQLSVTVPASVALTVFPVSTVPENPGAVIRQDGVELCGSSEMALMHMIGTGPVISVLSGCVPSLSMLAESDVTFGRWGLWAWD
jgi:hypothetical protein